MATHPQPLHPAATAIPPDERDLVLRAQAGDLAAFEQIVERFEPRVLRLARRVLGSSADDAAGDAEDVLQETFLKVHAKLRQFRFQSRLYTWIVRIAVNEALMKLRKRRGNVVSLDEPVPTDEGLVARDVPDWHPNPEQQYQSHELAEILQHALAGLAFPYRVVFQLRDVEELSTQETGEVLGLSEAAVKSRLLRARLQLRQRLSRHFGLEGAARGL